MLTTQGLHHVTAVAADPQTNLDFHTAVLGLRLVKLTVNFDDPSTYHFYFGDRTGKPGSVLTYFPWLGIGPGSPPNSPGAGETQATAFAVPRGSLDFWRKHLRHHGVHPSSPGETAPRFGSELLTFTSPDSMSFELIEADDHRFEPWPDNPARIPAEHAIRGFAGVTLRSRRADQTGKVLTDLLGFRLLGTEGNRTRYAAPENGHVDVVQSAQGENLARLGAGSVHHVAFRSSAEDHLKFIETVSAAGLRITPPQDRSYFRSLYFREPGGILFEIATDDPGFSADEPLTSLGTSLKLPPSLEKHRKEIEPSLPKLNLP
jgi:glyoxalase family protein